MLPEDGKGHSRHVIFLQFHLNLTELCQSLVSSSKYVVENNLQQDNPQSLTPRASRKVGNLMEGLGISVLETAA